MPKLEIIAVDEFTRLDSVAVADTATDAVVKFLIAREQYERVWVRDEAGNILTFDDLATRAQEEDRNA